MEENINVSFPDACSRQGAVFSPCGNHRYILWRRWNDNSRLLLYVLLNPSTADGENEDRTTRRCRYFAEQYGAGGMIIVNVFSFVATRTDELKRHLQDLRVSGNGGLHEEAAFAEVNARYVREVFRHVEAVVAAWGRPPFASSDFTAMQSLLKHSSLPVLCLGTTCRGFPRHPSRVAAATQLVAYHTAL